MRDPHQKSSSDPDYWRQSDTTPTAGLYPTTSALAFASRSLVVFSSGRLDLYLGHSISRVNTNFSSISKFLLPVFSLVGLPDRERS